MDVKQMDYSECLYQIQKYLENSPLIILGAGSSATYGLPLMGEISEEIKRHNDKFPESEFRALCDNLTSMNLEEAIDKASISDDSFIALRKIVWEYINKRDIVLLRKLTHSSTNFALADLLQIIIQPTPNTATIVTTNYDRLSEYAVDLIGATAVTGFEGNLIRKMEFPTVMVNNKPQLSHTENAVKSL
jgi:hypothetical protein